MNRRSGAVVCAVIAVAVLILGGCGSNSTSSSTSTSVKPPRRGFGAYTTCTGRLDQGNGNPYEETWRLKTADKYEHDDWKKQPDNPPVHQLYEPRYSTWKTESGVFRGCWNTVTFELSANGDFNHPDGTVTVHVEVPWESGNNRSCTPTGPYTCRLDPSTLGGKDQVVNYSFLHT